MFVRLCTKTAQQMMSQQRATHKPKPPRGDTRFPGICRHAQILGVDRSSLYRALTGEWKLPDLVQRYHALLAKEQQGR